MVSPKDKKKAVSQIRAPRARWILHLQATFWRVLMGVGMLLHHLAPPRAPKPNFIREIPAITSGKAGLVALHFYLPKDYETQKKLWIDQPAGDDEEEEEEQDLNKGKGKDRRVSLSSVTQHIRRRSFVVRKWGGYPVVINFHGGGFTLGTATDDARWCGTVVNECHAVVVSVDYRLAPEYPFPTAVEDGVDAVLWVHEHADELGIDREKIALSGFSSGGNMAFSVPLRLYDEVNDFPRDSPSEGTDVTYRPASRLKLEKRADGATASADSSSSSSTKVPPDNPNEEILDPNDPPPPDPRHPKKSETTVTQRDLPDVHIKCLVPWYPSLDYTRTRDERRATSVRKDQELPALFTDLFDESYLHPPNTISLDSPYLSPGVAPTPLLRNALPEEIIMHTCEWDMLLDEGIAFKERLSGPEIGKKVWYSMVEGVPHGWDKAPNPWKPTPGVREHYLRACKEMRRVLGQNGLNERETNEGPSAAPRGSVQVVR